MSPGQLVLVIGLCVVALCAGAVALVGVFVSPAPEPEPWRVEAATNPASGGPKASVPGNSPKLVVEITGTGPATISWQLNGTGGQDTEAALPWKREFGPFEGFAVWSFVAQTKNGTTSAAVRIQMSYGDKVYGPCEAQGPYSVATCTTNS